MDPQPPATSRRLDGARTVFVLRALGLGDALTGVPALRGLRRAYPDSRLLLGTTEEVGAWLASMGVVDEVVPTDGLAVAPRCRRPDVAVNLHGCGPQSHRVLQRTMATTLVGFRCPAADFTAGPAWDQSAHEVDRWCTLSRWAGGPCDRSDLRLPRPPRGEPSSVIVHPGAAAASRRWPVDRWRQVIAGLAGERVLVTGGPSEAELCAAVCAGSAAECRAGTSLAAVAALVAHTGLLISGDTGIAHLATAFGTPSVTLFGPVAPALWGPAIDLPVHRCIWHDDGRRGDPHRSSIDPRLESIGVDEVLAAARELLGARRPRPAR